MESLKAYILSVVSAALLAGIAREILGKKSGTGVLVYLISGLLLAAVVMKPLASLDFADISYHMPLSDISAEDLIADGKRQSVQQKNVIIKQVTESYILDKAKEYHADIQAEVTLSDGDIPVPEYVCIRGAVSPYTKMQLTNYIQDELGIPEVNQKWIGP